jgi:hypothetical protein
MFLLVYCLAYFSTVKKEAICSSETSGCLRATRRYNPEYHNLYFLLTFQEGTKFIIWKQNHRHPSECPLFIFFLFHFIFLFLLRFIFSAFAKNSCKIAPINYAIYACLSVDPYVKLGKGKDDFILKSDIVEVYYNLPLYSRWNHSIKLGDKSFENVAQFKYSGTTVTSQNLIQEEIKRRLNLDNAYYHWVQGLLSYRLLFKNVKIRIYKTTILPVVLYGCETWSLTLS